jgi:hypothetical protein
MHAVHSALSQLAEAIAAGAIDRHSAHFLLSVLRVASSNLRHPEKWQPSLFESAEPAPDVDVTAEYRLPADLDLDTQPQVAFPPPTISQSVILSGGDAPSASPESKDPFVSAFGSELVGSGNQPPATDHSLSEMPFSGNYCGYHHSRECECCRIRADYPVTPEAIEVVELHQKYGDDLAGVRGKQLERNRQRRELRNERKRYEAIALERNMRRAVDLMTEQKLAALARQAQAATSAECATPKPPASAFDPTHSSAQLSQDPT